MMAKIGALGAIAALAAMVVCCKARPVRSTSDHLNAADPGAREQPRRQLKEGRAERIRRVHENALVFDSHCDTLTKVVDLGVDLGTRSEDGDIDMHKAAEGGLDIQLFAAWPYPEDPTDQKRITIEMIEAMHATVAKHSDRIGLALTVADARRIVGKRKLAAFLGIEGGYVLEDDPAQLKLFYNRGVRCMTLTWMNGTTISSCSAPP